ncbi:MAG: glycosyltransferase family 39 protein [Pseudomonadota bacterium]|nr:glycosyltransferase family 39 protein [Pseudomonadota bacterium]
MTVPFKKSALLLVLACLALAVLVGHQTVPPMDRDESRFAQASRQMAQTGDLVTIRFQDEIRAKKPAGIYWLQASAASLFGANDIAPYRLPSLLAMLLTVYGTYRIARTLYKPPRAVLAAAACGGALVVFAEAHLAKTDSVLMLLCLMQQFGLMQIYRAWQHGRRLSYHSYLWVWLPMAAAVLVKGPVAPLLALTTVAALSAWHRNVRWLRMLRAGRGLLVLCLVTLPWAVMVTLATDGAFLDIAFRGDFLAKVQSGQESHGAPVGSYLMLAAILLWPASLLLPRAASQMPLLLSHVESRFLVAWILPFWVVIEFVPTKLPHYPLPVVPAIMVLLVCAVDAPLAGVAKGGMRAVARRWLALAGEAVMLAAGPVLVACLAWAALTYGGVTGGRAFAFAMLCALMAGLALWQGIVWHRHGGIRPVAMVIAAGAVMNMIAIGGLIPSLSRVHMARAIDTAITDAGPRPAAIAAAGFHEPSLVFHLGRDLLLVDGGEAALFLAEAPGGLAIVERDQQTAFLNMAGSLGLEVEVIRQIEGFNMSKGRDVLIFLYRADAFDPRRVSG